MREIKFRAWNKDLNMMVYSKELKGYIEYDTNPLDVINIMLNEDDYGYEFMEYTGLKDRYGKEIYEGDIVLKRVSMTTPSRERIEWDDKGARFRVTNYDGSSDDLSYWVRWDEIQVIGNIYENSKLLNA